ncbi:MAG: flagellar hook-basal body complex protein FliE [Candidatus Hydrogenedentota bacterium]|nr:MAG: flagellar hook-basal body complex protein FliE [Candidatus Hydrogenedentota bacterium]
MVDEITIGGVTGPRAPQPIEPRPPARPEETSGPSFKEYLTDSIREIQQLQTVADETINKLVTGEVTNVSEAMIAIEKANLAFLTLLQVRNKIISAYDQIQRMQI